MPELATFPLTLTCPSCERSSVVTVSQLTADDGDVHDLQFLNMPPDCYLIVPVKSVHEATFGCTCGRVFHVEG
jgi:hypothetical protein